MSQNSTSYILRYGIILASEHEIEVFEKEEVDTEDWSSGDRDDVEWLDVTSGYSGKYWWNWEYDQTPCWCRRGWYNRGMEGTWCSWYCLGIVVELVVWCLSGGILNLEKEAKGGGNSEGEKLSWAE